MSLLVLSVLGALVLLALLALSAVRMVQQYERGVVFVLGRLSGAKGLASSGPGAQLAAHCLATALPTNADRDCGGEELDHYLPAPH